MGLSWNASLRRYGLLLLATAVAGQSSPSCKPIPGDDHWPSVETWEALNETISGRLIATVPVGSVCHIGGEFDGHYNTTECIVLQSTWNFAQAQYVITTRREDGRNTFLPEHPLAASSQI